MIESIISPRTAERTPWKTVAGGIIFTLVAIAITYVIGSFSACSGSGYLLVSFITIAAAPLFVRIFCIEEHKHAGNLFQRHAPVIEMYAYFFLGVIIASSIFYVVNGAGSKCLFSDQLGALDAIGVIHEPIQACAAGAGITTGMSIAPRSWESLFTNNFSVLLLLFMFSLVLGAGSVWLISWNASVIGVLIGYRLDPFILVKILPHGILEFGGYFLGAVAGGILSAAIIQERIKTEYKRVILDSLVYFGISTLMILLGALLESGL